MAYPIDVPGARSSVGTVKGAKHHIKNFAELIRLLRRLTGKVDWQWNEAEEAPANT